MRAVLTLLALVSLAGCHRDGLVVVKLEADPPLSGLSKLHITGMIGPRTSVHDDDVPPAYASLPAATPFTFAIWIDPSYGSDVALTVEAFDAGGQRLAIGRGSAPVRGGARTDTTITLGPNDGTTGTTCVFDRSAFDHCTFAP